MNNKELYYQIKTLIELGYEGSFWDFKEVCSERTSRLIHDIICMANNLENRDAYIIFGVNDSCEIVGIENDKNRKKQQMIIDILNGAKFVGSIRPMISLRTLELCNHEVDVLIIHNSNNTPYYLIDRKEDICAYNIYTRVGDTNTPVNRHADPNNIEYLWKKRFNIIQPPLEKMKNFIQEDMWEEREEFFETIFYNKMNPEYTIKILDNETYERRGAEFYSYTMTDKTVKYEDIQLDYFGTTLYKKMLVYLDGCRYKTIVPSWGFVPKDKYNKESIAFKYYLKDSIDFLLHNFLTKDKNGQTEEMFARRRYEKLILFFENEDEKVDFIKYISNNLEVFENKKRMVWEDIPLCLNGISLNEHTINVEKINDAKALKNLLKEYRNSD